MYDTVFNNCHVVRCTVVWVSSSGIRVENGQCKRFYKHLLGLLKRANCTKQYKRNTEKSSPHLHRYHEATCFVCGGERRDFVLVTPSAGIQVFQSHFIAEFVLILKNQKKNHKVSYWRNLIKGINISLLLKLLTVSCCQWEPVCKSDLYSGKKIFVLTRQ